MKYQVGDRVRIEEDKGNLGDVGELVWPIGTEGTIIACPPDEWNNTPGLEQYGPGYWFEPDEHEPFPPGIHNRWTWVLETEIRPISKPSKLHEALHP